MTEENGGVYGPNGAYGPILYTTNLRGCSDRADGRARRGNTSFPAAADARNVWAAGGGRFGVTLSYGATGWARTVSGIQSLLSVYLLAIWALTYFGRPFE